MTGEPEGSHYDWLTVMGEPEGSHYDWLAVTGEPEGSHYDWRAVPGDTIDAKVTTLGSIADGLAQKTPRSWRRYRH